MSGLKRAAEVLRADIAALARRHREAPWTGDDAGNIFAPQVNAWIGEMTNSATALYVARIASPDVVTALADLFDAVESEWAGGIPADADARTTWVFAAALAAAILRDRP